MKNSVYNYAADSEIATIVFDIQFVDLTIIPSQDNSLQITCENDKRLDICLNESTLTLTQGNCNPLFFHKKKRIEIRVPDHTLPDIAITAKGSAIKFLSGIYGRFTIDGEGCSLNCENAAFAECTITGGVLSTYFSGVTVKNMLVVKCEAGDVLWERSFAGCTECRVKRGNIGLSGFNCKDSIMEAETGNVAARLNGEESDYSLGLLIKEGTANRESVLREGAARSFKAYSAKGNIAIEFMPEDEDTIYGES